MKFEDVSEFLHLDNRDDKRNRLLLGAVSELILVYLDRKLLTDTVTETIWSTGSIILPREYPVREISELVDAQTGETIVLTDTFYRQAILRPDAYRQIGLRIQNMQDLEVRITYRYGYALDEIPLLIREAVLCMIADRLRGYGKQSAEDAKELEKARLECISGFKRNSLL